MISTTLILSYTILMRQDYCINIIIMEARYNNIHLSQRNDMSEEENMPEQNSPDNQMNIFKIQSIKQLDPNSPIYKVLQCLDYFKLVNGQIIRQYQKNIQELSNQLQKHVEVKELIIKIQETDSIELQKRIKSICITPEKIQEFTTILNSYNSRSFSKQLQQLNKNINKYNLKNKQLISQFNQWWATQLVFDYRFIKVPSKLIYSLSQDLKSIKVSENNYRDTNDKDNSLLFAMTQPTLNNKKQKIQFKVANTPGKSRKFLFLGAAHVNTVSKNQYSFNRKLGDGVYVIGGETGYAFNHFYEQENMMATDFIFREGDYVQIQYNPGQYKLVFSNLTKSLKATLSICPFDKQDPLGFCAIMCHNETRIQIIPPDSM